MRKPVQPPRMSEDEQRIARDLYYNKKMRPCDIAKTLSRDKSSISRLLNQKKPSQDVGRPVELTKEKIDKIVDVLEQMVEEADATWEVTLAMVMRRARTKFSERTIRDALHDLGYRFRKLRSKMILTPEDIKVRYEWAKTYKDKPKEFFLKAIQIHLDNHHFKVATTSKGRKLLAKRSVRGAYRKKAKSLTSAHVKPDPKLRIQTGPKGILKMGGVGNGKVLVWETVIGRWSGDQAAAKYTDVVLPALKKQYPSRSSFTILEDNDPTGNMSKKGIAAKAACKMRVLSIPKRSPDLNVLDYSIWSAVERRLRAQERKMPSSKAETRAQFETRLNRTARALPKDFIERSIMNLKERAQRLYKAKGGLFDEGGKRKRES